MEEHHTQLRPNPVTSTNIISRILFWWMNPLFRTGYKRSLDIGDMYQTLPEDSSQGCQQQLQREWDKELEETKNGKAPRLHMAMLRTYGWEHSKYGVVVFIEEAIKVSQPILMGYLIRYFKEGSEVTTLEAYMYALGVGLGSLVVSLFHHLYFFNVMLIGMRMRVACCSLIYNKALRLSNTALGQVTTGHIVNLMSNDVARFDTGVHFLHFLWAGPIEAAVVVVILWVRLGPAVLAGFTLLLLLVPLQGVSGRLFATLREFSSVMSQGVIFLMDLLVAPMLLVVVFVLLWHRIGASVLPGYALLLLCVPLQLVTASRLGTLRRKVAVLTDERVRLMNEILTGMRVIKMYCWENMFADLVHSVRRTEVKRVLNTSFARAAAFVPFFSSAKLIAYLTFLVFVLEDRPLDSESVFVALALFQPLRITITLFFPFAIQSLSEMRVTIERIQEFLLLEEQKESSSILNVAPSKPSDCKVTGVNVSAVWDKTSNNLTLNDMSFEVRSGELLAVIGPVGAGKSSLLMSILGELALTQGSIKVVGKVAYASQQPWVFSASVRQNITFGKEFDKENYNAVIKASALTKDLELLVHGDQTLVGDRGVSLSGGQKARISLARALYSNADVYLLDDPLSAVDTTVGRHIFDKCISGFLRKKPRILVTHQLQYLKAADRIIVLKDGQMCDSGTFEELSCHGVDFTALLKSDSDSDQLSTSLINSDILSETTLNRPLGHPPYGTLCKLYLSEPSSSEMDLRTAGNMKGDAYLSKSLDNHHPMWSLLVDPLEAREVQSLACHHEKKASSVMLLHKVHHQRAAQKKSKKLTFSSGALHKGTSRKDELLGLHRQLSVAKSMEVLAQAEGFGSMLSLDSLNADIKADYVAPLKEEEHRAEGTVGVMVYIKYFYHGAGVLGMIIFVLLNLLAQSTYTLADWWLSYWSLQEEQHQGALAEHQALLEAGHNQTNISVPDVDTYRYLHIYTGITLSVVLFGTLRALQAFCLMVRAGKVLHNKMFASIIRCPILFFDTNPVGRILNRFSKDMGLVDETLPTTMFDFISCALQILAIILVAGMVNPWVFLLITPLAVLFVFLRRYYLSTSRDVKRIEATARSPLFSHISASLHGIQTLRAYSLQDQFQEDFHSHQDVHTAAWYMFLVTSRWFAIRLDLLCSGFIMTVAISSVVAAESLNTGLVGLTLTYALGLMGLFQWGVRQSAEVENQMTSVERIMEYSSLPPEAALTVDEHKPSEDWPSSGAICGKNVTFRYSDSSPLVLNNLTFSIRPREKIGIVGRTGAGKSSLIAMLFRLAEPGGEVLIDDINIHEIGLHDLRRKIAIIPQDPVLFTGTVRRNLDPFHQHKDLDLWNALREVQLQQVVQELPSALEAEVTEGGTNFSVGQRQLLCLARAILKHNRILVIDEATANVDPRTDALIQETIRIKFKECTVLTIAHRLHTIMDSDRVMVMQEGQLMEFSHPYTLVQDASSLFHQMLQQGGPAELNKLKDIAYRAYLDHNTRSVNDDFSLDQPNIQSTDDKPSSPTNLSPSPQSVSGTFESTNHRSASQCSLSDMAPLMELQSPATSGQSKTPSSVPGDDNDGDEAAAETSSLMQAATDVDV